MDIYIYLYISMLTRVDLTWSLVEKVAQMDYWRGYFHSGKRVSDSAAEVEIIFKSVLASAHFEDATINSKDIRKIIKDFDRDLTPSPSPSSSSTGEQEAAGYYCILMELKSNFHNMAFTMNNIRMMHVHLHQFLGKRMQPEDFYMEDELGRLMQWTKECFSTHCMHPIIIIAAFEYEFIRIHRFQEGCEKISRLITRWLLYRMGYEFVRMVSIEEEILRRRKDYYGRMEQCQAHPEENINPWVDIFLDSLLNRCQLLSSIITPVELGDPDRDERMSPRRQRILNFMNGNEAIRVGELSSRLAININTLKKDLQDLVSSGYLEKQGRGRGTYYYSK